MAMSASGTFMDPFFIFPRQRMHDALMVGAPPESKFACNSSGWSTLETFSQWFDSFLRCYRPTKEDPVLLILDGHSSHTRNLEVLEKARVNHTRILSIPPHTSHKLQPLDVAFMGPFKGAYSEALDRLLKRNGGKAETIYNVAALVNEAFKQTAKKTVAHNDYKTTGIMPFDRNVFSDAYFAASDSLRRPF
ncbi:uncharacterized protein LOC129733260 [Wyeomyia smithii]|uniref:uncharacterized protein LOC129733260 n=1 Tax=Wyeomyia smithii TaxID=174621 RepID=UPI002467C755|nr:uncharacterized protein LOC129733260 [Wyeomyia smithii]